MICVFRRLGSLSRLVALLLLAGGLEAVSGEAVPEVSARPVPVVYCTDLFHPHDDPDDHFDLAALYALPGIDLRGIVLDQSLEQGKRPGRIPVSQLNHLTGRQVRCAPGLARPLASPSDEGRDQPTASQAGIALLLECLRSADRPVAIIAVGSVRDVTAAFNRERALFQAKVGQVLAFIGEASDPAFREYNVGLDPQAYVGLMRSGLPLWWVPCFDGGAWQNRGRASFWEARHVDLLASAPGPLVQYFIYALDKETADPLAFLAARPDPVRQARLFAGTRNLWCTAIFGVVADRWVTGDPEAFLSDRPTASRAARERPAPPVFGFEEVHLAIDDQAVVRPGAGPGARLIRRFVVRDAAHYGPAMTAATAALLARFPVADLSPGDGR